MKKFILLFAFAACATAHAAFQTPYGKRVSTLNAAGTAVVGNYTVESNNAEFVMEYFDYTTNTWKSGTLSDLLSINASTREIGLNTGNLIAELGTGGMATQLYADTVAAAAADAVAADIDAELVANYTKTANLGSAAFVPTTNFATAAQGTLASTALQSVSWPITGTPSTFAPSAHTHAIADVTGLQTAINGKQAVLSGTGFVKSTGGTISYDTATYYLASNPNGYTSNVGTVTSVTAGAGLSGGTFSVSGTVSMPNVGTAGTYGSVTTDAQGRVTAGKRVEAFSGVTNASGQYTVSFSPAYSVAPNIQANIINGADNQNLRITSVSTTGFTVLTRTRTDVVGLLPTWSNASGLAVDVLITEK